MHARALAPAGSAPTAGLLVAAAAGKRRCRARDNDAAAVGADEEANAVGSAPATSTTEDICRRPPSGDPAVGAEE